MSSQEAVFVKIIGAGSIGNHLAHACRGMGWRVSVFDIDPQALKRMRDEIYPSRYGKWDENIKLVFQEDDAVADLLIIGTPPDTHLAILERELKKARPARMILVEKPLCEPTVVAISKLQALGHQVKDVRILVGYNHRMTQNTRALERIASENLIGRPVSLSVNWQEHWGGIFKAHPWLSGPSDSYLGYYGRGGGALAEHSHGINLWQYAAKLFGFGQIENLSAQIKFEGQDGCDYDCSSQISIRTDTGALGYIIQDVVTSPAVKLLKVQGDAGFVHWYANYDNQHDAIVSGKNGEPVKLEKFAKSRPDDFKGEIEHLADLLRNPSQNSVLDIEAASETMQIICAALLSNQRNEQIAFQSFCKTMVGGL